MTWLRQDTAPTLYADSGGMRFPVRATAAMPRLRAARLRPGRHAVLTAGYHPEKS
jgi:hypothetical protein